MDYAGFEPVHRLIAAAVVEGVPIEPTLAAEIFACGRWTARRSRSSSIPPGSMTPWTRRDSLISDKSKKGSRSISTRLSGSSSGLSRTRSRQPPRTGQDRRQLRSARDRRDQIVGSSARERVEEEIERLATRDEALERRINALDSREDQVYRRADQYHELRYRAPKVTRLFRVAFRKTLRTRRRRAEAAAHCGLAPRATVPVIFRGGAEEAVAGADGGDLRILDVAREQRYAVLCAGDLFDDPTPSADFWGGLVKVLRDQPPPMLPCFLFPATMTP